MTCQKCNETEGKIRERIKDTESELQEYRRLVATTDNEFWRGARNTVLMEIDSLKTILESLQ